MKEIEVKNEWNYIVTNGWTIIFLDNKPVNYHADHGELDTTYLCIDPLFVFLVEYSCKTVDIVDIIVKVNEIQDVLRK